MVGDSPLEKPLGWAASVRRNLVALDALLVFLGSAIVVGTALAMGISRAAHRNPPLLSGHWDTRSVWWAVFCAVSILAAFLILVRRRWEKRKGMAPTFEERFAWIDDRASRDAHEASVEALDPPFFVLHARVAAAVLVFCTYTVATALGSTNPPLYLVDIGILMAAAVLIARLRAKQIPAGFADSVMPLPMLLVIGWFCSPDRPVIAFIVGVVLLLSLATRWVRSRRSQQQAGSRAIGA